MLEDPSYESIVRWGDGGESFVVLEVCYHLKVGALLVITFGTERQVYQVDPAQAFQA